MICMQRTHIQLNGKMCRRMITMILACSLLLSGCSTDFCDWLVGDGRGDWTLDLISGYCIVKVNSRCIEIGYKDDPEDSSCSNVIPLFFVTAYQIEDPYIAIEGIPTQKFSITDEELVSRNLNYYLIDTVKGTLDGPYETMDDFNIHCASFGLKIEDEWVAVNGNIAN